MDRAVAFYRDVLGLEVNANVPFSPNPAIMRLGNTPGAQSRMMALRAPDATVRGCRAGGEAVEIRPGLKIAIVRDPNNLMLELMQAN
jgi:catechol 2,3-dioxygenase-like lactoylglutathione lyase family enzyme